MEARGGPGLGSTNGRPGIIFCFLRGGGGGGGEGEGGGGGRGGTDLVSQSPLL